MGYFVVDPGELASLDGRPCETRALVGNRGTAADFEHLGVRLYEPDPGKQIPLKYHYHDEQEEAFYVLSGSMHVETPETEYVVDAGEVFLVEAGSPHRAFNPSDAPGPIRVLAVGAPTHDGGNLYEPSS